jgi:anti-sigma B factor antagonist
MAGLAWLHVLGEAQPAPRRCASHGVVGNRQSFEDQSLTPGAYGRDAESVDSNADDPLGERLHLFTATLHSSRTVVSVAGEVDHLTAARLGDALGAAILSGARWVAADFRQVRFCDCAGLSVLLAARSHFEDAGVCFSVSGPVTPVVDRLFQLTGTGQLLRRREAA